MDFILFVFIVMLAVSLSNAKFRLSKLERKVKSIEEQGVQVVTDMIARGSVSENETPLSQKGAVPSSAQTVNAGGLGVDTKESIAGTVPYEFPSNQQAHISTEEIGGRWLGKIGIAAVLVGLSFFVKYAFDNNWVGPFGRVCIGLLIGALAIVLGQMLRKAYENYSDMLMGGGIGVLYLSAYSGFFFYHLFEAPLAYIFLLCITAVAVLLSLANSAKTLAVVGVVGGMATPLLVSMSSPGYIELLTYILILDLGVVIVSYVYKWIELNRAAFIGTLICLMASMSMHVSSVDAGFKLVSVTFYAYAFVYFLIFLASSIAHHVVRKEVSVESDVAFVFMNGVIHACLGYILLNPVYPDFMGYFMLLLAILYSVVAYVSFITHKEDKLLNKFLAGMAAGFLTAAIPLHFDGAWIAIIWFVEAVVFYLIDKSLKGENLYNYGVVVYALGLLQVFFHTITNSLGKEPVFINTNFGLYVLAIITAYVLAGIVSSEISDKTETDSPLRTLRAVYFGVANLLTLFSITSEISRFYALKAAGSSYYSEARGRLNSERNTAISIFWMLYALLMLAVGFVGKIRYLRLFGLALFFITALKLFFEIFTLGPLYAIVSSIALGVLALMGSFGYAKYSEKLKQLM